METLTNMVLGFQMDQYELSRVQERLAFEWEQSRTSVDALLDDAIHRAAYKSHPYGNPLVSNPEHIKLSSEELRSYTHSALVRINNGILGIGVEHEHLVALQGVISRERNPEHPRALVAESSAYRGLGEERIEAPSQNTEVLIAFEAPSLTSPDCAVSLLLSALLGGHRSTTSHIGKADLLRLCSRTTGCLDATPYIAMHAQSALFGVKFTFSSESGVNDIRQCIDNTFVTIKRSLKGIHKDDLERARKMALLTYASRLEERSSAVVQFSHQVNKHITHSLHSFIQQPQ